MQSNPNTYNDAHVGENVSVNEAKNVINAQAVINDQELILRDFKENGRRALIIMPEDAEISEVAQMADIMRRAGISVIIASLHDSDYVRSSSNVVCKVDTTLSRVTKEPPFDALVLPGGLLAAKLLGESYRIRELLKEYETKRRWIVVIGDAPLVLRKHFIGAGKTLTCHPLIKHKIESSEYMKYQYIDDDVFVDGKIITCKGGPHTMQCALNLVHLLCGRSIAESVGEKLLIQYNDGYCRDCCGNCKYCCQEYKKKIEPDIADRFTCSTYCSVDNKDVVNWKEDKMMAEFMEKQKMINYKLRREELKDLEEERQLEKEEIERQIVEDEELENLKQKWRNGCCVSEVESDRYKRVYVEREEANLNARMNRKYDRQHERHKRSKRRQDLIDHFRNLEPTQIDAILNQFRLEQNLLSKKT